jgi:hypothetical protein
VEKAKATQISWTQLPGICATTRRRSGLQMAHTNLSTHGGDPWPKTKPRWNPQFNYQVPRKVTGRYRPASNHAWVRTSSKGRYRTVLYVHTASASTTEQRQTKHVEATEPCWKLIVAFFLGRAMLSPRKGRMRDGRQSRKPTSHFLTIDFIIT